MTMLYRLKYKEIKKMVWIKNKLEYIYCILKYFNIKLVMTGYYFIVQDVWNDLQLDYTMMCSRLSLVKIWFVLVKHLCALNVFHQNIELACIYVVYNEL